MQEWLYSTSKYLANLERTIASRHSWYWRVWLSSMHFVHKSSFRKRGWIQGEYSIIWFIHNSTYRAVAQASEKQILQPGSFVLQAPIYNPEKLICIGMNYVDHCTEQNIPVPEEPVIFSKFNSAITEPNGPVLLSDETQVDSTTIVHVCMSVQHANRARC